MLIVFTCRDTQSQQLGKVDGLNLSISTFPAPIPVVYYKLQFMLHLLQICSMSR